MAGDFVSGIERATDVIHIAARCISNILLLGLISIAVYSHLVYIHDMNISAFFPWANKLFSFFNAHYFS